MVIITIRLPSYPVAYYIFCLFMPFLFRYLDGVYFWTVCSSGPLWTDTRVPDTPEGYGDVAFRLPV